YAPSLIHDERDWGKYVDVKINAPQVLRSELSRLKKRVVFLSSAFDPYQPVEAKYRITRNCLEILQSKKFPVLILTRSPLILRDLDILEKFDWLRVGFSISSLAEKYHEPGVVPLEKRISALSKLGERKITTWVSLAPIVPGLPMINFETLFQKLKECGVSAVSPGLLRFNGYAESKRMFEERSNSKFADALVGCEVMNTINQLSRSCDLDDTDFVLSWTDPEEDRAIDSYSAFGPIHSSEPVKLEK
ncbi:MAG TPA: radical SAM protein, partial [Nitrososphaerales archaeon]|nr:radical SAM protein [Nitrososphaerales archaeon]